MAKNIERQEMILPNSPEAEETVLAAILHDPTQLPTLGLKPGDFYSVWNREIFRSMLALSRDNKPITWVHMYESLIGQPGHPNKPGEEYIDVTYLREVFDSTISAVHLHADAALVREKAIKRGCWCRWHRSRRRPRTARRWPILTPCWSRRVRGCKSRTRSSR